MPIVILLRLLLPVSLQVRAVTYSVQLTRIRWRLCLLRIVAWFCFLSGFVRIPGSDCCRVILQKDKQRLTCI